VIGTIDLRSHGYTPERATEFFERLRERLKANPAVDSITLAIYSGGMTSLGKLDVDGEPRKFPSTVWFTRIDDRYLKTYGMTLMQGRGFTRDDSAAATPVAIVSESFGRQLASGGNPLDHVIRLRQGTPPVRVVGVVSDVVSNVTVLEPLAIYLPEAQGPPLTFRDLAVHAATSASDARREILAAIRQLDPGVIPTPLRTFEDRFLQQMAAQKFGATVLGALGTLAVLLTLLGIYVLADSMATMRMREMGIRAALGATRPQLGALALAETTRLVGVGLTAGLFLVWLGASTIRSFLFQVKPLDPMTLGIVALSILVLAVVVTLRSAIRMSRVDLAGVLKAE
jgi:putative ABC transport system permease protein